MEDLDENPLYIALLTKFHREFEIASRMSCIVAIPASNSLNDVTIDQHLATSHILIPSKLLKMHYTPLQIGLFDRVEIVGRKLIVHTNSRKPIIDFSVNIIGEEIGYSINNNEFKTLLIDKPLLPSDKLLSTRFKINTKPFRDLRNHDDCSKYLEFLSPKLKMYLEMETRCLDRDIRLNSVGNLNSASKKIKKLVNNYVSKYELSVAGYTGSTFFDCVRHTIKLSVENYVLHTMHVWILSSIQEQYKRDDELLKVRFGKIRESRLTICQLGAQLAFYHFNLSEKLIFELEQLPYHPSPIALVTSLIKLVELMSECLNHSVKFGRLEKKDDDNCSNDKVSICSDDLIATFVFSLAQTKPDGLYSISKYLEMFSWSSNEKGKASYYTATFQIVIQYINSFLPDRLSGPSIAKSQHNTHMQDTRFFGQKVLLERGCDELLDSGVGSSLQNDSSSSTGSVKSEWD